MQELNRKGAQQLYIQALMPCGLMSFAQKQSKAPTPRFPPLILRGLDMDKMRSFGKIHLLALASLAFAGQPQPTKGASARHGYLLRCKIFRLPRTKRITSLEFLCKS